MPVAQLQHTVPVEYGVEHFEEHRDWSGVKVVAGAGTRATAVLVVDSDGCGSGIVSLSYVEICGDKAARDKVPMEAVMVLLVLAAYNGLDVSMMSFAHGCRLLDYLISKLLGRHQNGE